MCNTRVLLFASFVALSTALLPDNQAMPNMKYKVFKPTMKEIIKDCKWGTEKMGAVFEQPVLNYYPTTQQWKSYDGTRVIPERSESGWHFTAPWKKYPIEDRGIQGGKCEVPQADGSQWSLERVGPFKTTGGYDWWQFAWSNALNMREKLKKHPNGLYLLTTFTIPVTEDGEVLNFPPVHIHHIHFTGGPRSIFAMTPFCQTEKDWFGMNENVECEIEKKKIAASWIHEMHGDYGCKDEDGGVQCLYDDMPEGYGKLVKGPISVDGDVNDVRAFNSTEMTWYMIIGARWIANDEEILEKSSIRPKPKALSVATIGQPGRLDVSDQSSMVHTALIPTGFETLMWYTGKMKHSGTLIRAKTHTHNQIFQQLFMFTGPPEDVGLTSEFRPKMPHIPLATKSLGFTNNVELRDYLLAEWRTIGNSRLICETNVSFDVIDGYYWDRRSRGGCVPWEFKEGEQFTVIGFNGIPPEMKSVGPHMPNALTEYIPVHLAYFWMFDSHDGESHWSLTMHTQDVDHNYQFSLSPNMKILGVLYNGGTQTESDFRKLVMASLTALVVGTGLTAWIGYIGVSKLIKVD